jgi:hypothetical protein
LYYAVALTTEPIPTGIELVSNKPLVQNVIEQIDKIYAEIKKNEENPNMDYLYSNMDKQNNFEKSVKKLEMLENFSSIVPRQTP